MKRQCKNCKWFGPIGQGIGNCSHYDTEDPGVLSALREAKEMNLPLMELCSETDVCDDWAKLEEARKL